MCERRAPSVLSPRAVCAAGQASQRQCLEAKVRALFRFTRSGPPFLKTKWRDHQQAVCRIAMSVVIRRRAATLAGTKRVSGHGGQARGSRGQARGARVQSLALGTQSPTLQPAALRGGCKQLSLQRVDGNAAARRRSSFVQTPLITRNNGCACALHSQAQDARLELDIKRARADAAVQGSRVLAGALAEAVGAGRCLLPGCSSATAPAPACAVGTLNLLGGSLPVSGSRVQIGKPVRTEPQRARVPTMAVRAAAAGVWARWGS